MSAARHTPGPWGHFVLDRPLAEIPAYVEGCIKASPGTEFHFVIGPRPDGGDADICHVGNGAHSEANARLIAAAPELLGEAEANSGILQALLVHLAPVVSTKVADDIRSRMDATDAAIAKAKGGAPDVPALLQEQAD